MLRKPSASFLFACLATTLLAIGCGTQDIPPADAFAPADAAEVDDGTDDAALPDGVDDASDVTETTGQTCVTDDDCAKSQWCDVDTCKADVCGDEAICQNLTSVSFCAGNGSGWIDQNCEFGEACHNGICGPVICTPNETECAISCNETESNCNLPGVATCNEAGTGWDKVACPEPQTCVDAVCVPTSCVASSVTCNQDGDLVTCAADGQSSTVTPCTDTAEGDPQVCTETEGSAACTPLSCPPGAAYCKDGLAMQCDLLGATATEIADCGLPGPGGEQQVCVEGQCITAVCLPDAVTCTDLATKATCSADGQGWEQAACDQGMACEGGNCLPIVCVPGQLQCDGTSQRLCNPAGTETTFQHDCATDGLLCIDGQCGAAVCTGGTAECQNGLVATCKDDGTGWWQMPCPSDQVCAAGKCSAKVCTPAESKCEGKVVKTCNSAGSAWTDTEDCSITGKNCLNGGCQAVMCPAGSKVCEGAVVMTCADNGTGWFKGDDCGAKLQYCDKGACQPKLCTPDSSSCQAGKLAICNEVGAGWIMQSCPVDTACAEGACKPIICVPEKLKCDAKQVVRCDATGTGYQIEQDCGAFEAICIDSQCIVPTCEPGKVECQGGKVATCNANATAWTFATCAVNTVCVVDKCLAKVCTAGAVECQSGQVATCNATGTAWVKVACGANEVCVTNKCLAKVCTAKAVECQQGKVATCNDTGTAWTSVACSQGQACVGNKCVVTLCAPAATECQTGKLATCNATGTAWTAADCPANQACESGACKDKICTPAALKCDVNNLQACDPTGTTWKLSDDCAAKTAVCKVDKCVPKVCDPNVATCQADKLGMCSADGTLWEPKSCDDANACTVEGCANAECSHTNAQWGTACGDNMICKEGSCVEKAAGEAASVVAGGDHTCILTTAGTVVCWGANAYGQLGNGSTTDSPQPVAVTGLSGVSSIALGLNHSCALVSGAVKCWGYNSNAQLGDGTTTNAKTPVAVKNITTATAIAAGATHSCAILTDATIKCWGNNEYGQGGTNFAGGNLPSPLSVAWLGSDPLQLVAAGNHSCVRLADGATKCWGRNNKGQIGDGTSGNLKSIPTLVFGLSTSTVGVAAGFEHACALVGEAVVCWGDASAGQLGDGSTTGKTKPVAVATLAAGVDSLATGQGLHTCAILKSGAVNCWGANGYGQTGKGSASASQTTPTQVAPLGAAVTAVTVGSSHTCALIQGPKVQCWGHNDVGQMGDGTTGASKLTPTYVLGFGQ